MNKFLRLLAIWEFVVKSLIREVDSDFEVLRKLIPWSVSIAQSGNYTISFKASSRALEISKVA